ncbi:DNA polymerase III subunit tau [Candidatus Izimaplasma bacterium HR1]|uniref:DNA polymerase III subunit delta' n=1 Tax=Candidatus Izimoplasma sp. HR1 TaxID=1541959 RepID=UPI0004F59DCE|nr:DNA polymerase III subunit tau [Candidatus Izimaplasma bacterium HR1]
MAFDKIKESQPKVVQLLENSLKKDRLSHAYLFEGEKGTMKFETALYFAQMLLCKSEDTKPCLECKNCKRIKNGTHPNVYVIRPEKNIIKKQQVQDLQTEFSKTSIEPGPKIYIIKDIETIHVSAANSLLKFLEEPFPNIHAILTTSNINRILPTIISRSQVVQFQSLNHEIVKQEMIEAGYSDETSAVLSELTNSIETAMEIASSEYYLDLIDNVKEIYRIINTNDQSLVIYFNENNSIIYQDKEKEQATLFLSLMTIYQKDVINYITGNMRNIVFKDELGIISGIVDHKPKNRLIDELEHMLTLQSRLNNYINERLAFENLLLDLERR